MTTWRVAALSALVASVVLAIQLPGLLSGSGFPAEPDVFVIEVEPRGWFFSHLRAGQSGLLYPGAGLGVSLLSAPTYGILNPTSWLGLLVPSALAVGLAWYLHTMLCAAGWTVALLRLGFPAAASVGAPAFILASGICWSFHAVTGLDGATLAWSGWVVVAVIGWCERRRILDAAGIGLTVGLALLAGDPFIVPVIVGVAVLLCWDRRPTPGVIIRAVGVAGAVALIMILPLAAESRAFFPLSERAAPFGLSPYEALSFSTPPARLLEVLSGVFRLSGESRLTVNQGGMNTHDFWYPSLTLGVPGVIVCAVGARAMIARGARHAVLLVAVGVLVALSFGRWADAVVWAWEHVPPLTVMRFPERLWRFVGVILIPISAAGFHAIAARVGASAVGVAWLVVAVTVGVAIVEQPASLTAPLLEAPPEFAALQAGARRHDVRVNVDGRGDLAATQPRFDTRVFGIPMAQAPDTTPSVVMKYTPPEYWPDNLALRWLGISHLIMPARGPHLEDATARLKLGAATSLGDTGWQLVVVDGARPSRGLLLDRLEVRRPFDSLGDGPLPAGPEGARTFPMPQPDLAPFLASMAAGTYLVDPSFHLDVDGSLRPGPAPLDLPTGCGATGAGVELAVASDATRIDADVTAACPSVLSVPWRVLPGWAATVDDKAVPIVAINGVTMGVPVPAGRSRVTLRFAPHMSAFIPVAIAFTMAVALALVSDARRRGRRPPRG